MAARNIPKLAAWWPLRPGVLGRACTCAASCQPSRSRLSYDAAQQTKCKHTALVLGCFIHELAADMQIRSSFKQLSHLLLKPVVGCKVTGQVAPHRRGASRRGVGACHRALRQDVGVLLGAIHAQQGHLVGGPAAQATLLTQPHGLSWCSASQLCFSSLRLGQTMSVLLGAVHAQQGRLVGGTAAQAALRYSRR